jgi:DNA-binding NtrC family response regulator
VIRLLYIDDNPDTCSIIASFCERIGTITIQILDSGELALEWLSRTPADVIVSDYNMPRGMNGIMLLQKLYSQGNRTPFILFTSEDSCDLKQEAYRNGAFSFISKASERNPIYQLIRTIYWAANQAGSD